jgi:sec-independent protein translocase protein TatC
MAKSREEEQFKGSVMTFGEHLEELRGCLWRAILGIAAGFVVGLFLASRIVQFIQSPLEIALQNYYIEDARAKLLEINPNATDADLARVLKEHMVFERVYVEPKELADAVRRANPDQQPKESDKDEKATPAFTGGMQELLLWHNIDNDPRTRTKSLAGQEPFMIWLKAALIAGLVLSSPWVFYQLWMFIAAGLYSSEKRLVHVYLPISIGLFLFGVFMSTFVFPPILKFFLSFNRSMGIDPEPRISEWLSFVLFLPLGFGLAFQLPLVMLFLERVGLFTVQSYLKQWRFAVLVIWVIAAVVTPSDPISIFYLAVPLMALFFGGVMLCKWWPRQPKENKR